MSHRRIFLMALALGFIGGFSVVAVAGISPPAPAHYSATG